MSINPLADRESHQVPEKFLGPSCSVVFLTSLSLFLNMIVGGLWYYYVACCSSVSSVVDSRLGSQVSMLETSTFRGRGTIRSRMLAFCFFFLFSLSSGAKVSVFSHFIRCRSWRRSSFLPSSGPPFLMRTKKTETGSFAASPGRKPHFSPVASTCSDSCQKASSSGSHPTTCFLNHCQLMHKQK